MDRPRVGVSACLLGERVRHDGRHKRAPVVIERLRSFAEVIPLCPEVELGLGVPRPPIQLVERAGAIQLQVVDGDEELSEAMARFAVERIRELAPVHGLVVKARSPSCGPDVAVYASPRSGSAEVARDRGRFLAAILAEDSGTPFIDEEAAADDRAWQFFVAAVTRRWTRGD